MPMPTLFDRRRTDEATRLRKSARVLVEEIEQTLERALARSGDTEDLETAYVLATRAAFRLRRADDEDASQSPH